MPKRKPKIDHHLILEDVPKYFLVFGLLSLVVVTIWIISPFIPSLIIGAVIATGFYPLHKKILKYVKYRTVAAGLSFLLVLLIALLPLAWFTSYLTQEALETYKVAESKVAELLALDITLIPGILKDSPIGPYLEQASEIAPVQPEDIIGFASTLIQNTSQFLVGQTTAFAKSLSVLAFHFFVLMLSIFFFLKDGDKVINEVKELLPLTPKYREEIVHKLHDMSQGILYGIFGAGIAQGFLAGIGFALVGIENAAFWGTIMAFFSVVPYIGAALIWVPASLLLLVTGHWIACLFLVGWGALIVSSVDNFIKPIVIGETARIHPLLSFLTILGGLFSMGLAGLIIAPYLVSLALTFLYIYKLEYQEVLEKH